MTILALTQYMHSPSSLLQAVFNLELNVKKWDIIELF
jgi:hypothetical protein